MYQTTTRSRAPHSLPLPPPTSPAMPTTSSATSSTTSTLPNPVTAPRRDSHPIVQEVNRRFNANLHEDFLAAMLEFCGTVCLIPLLPYGHLR